MSHTFVVALSVVAALHATRPLAASAQKRADSLAGARLEERIRGAARVKMQLVSGQTFELHRPMVEGAAIVGTLRPAGDLFSVPAGEVRRVWRRGSAWRAGLLAGASIGMVGGTIGGIALANFCLWGDCPPPPLELYVKAVAVGAIAGGVTLGVTGLLIAAPVRKWTPVFSTDQLRIVPAVSARGAGLRIEF